MCMILLEATFVFLLGPSEYPANGKRLIKYLLNWTDIVKQCIIFIDVLDGGQIYGDYLEAKIILLPWQFQLILKIFDLNKCY